MLIRCQLSDSSFTFAVSEAKYKIKNRNKEHKSVKVCRFCTAGNGVFWQKILAGVKNEIFKIKGAAPAAPTDETCLTVAGNQLITRVTVKSRGAGCNQCAWERHRGGGPVTWVRLLVLAGDLGLNGKRDEQGTRSLHNWAGLVSRSAGLLILVSVSFSKWI